MGLWQWRSGSVPVPAVPLGQPVASPSEPAPTTSPTTSPSAPNEGLVGTQWMAVQIGAASVVRGDGQVPSLRFTEAGEVLGSDPCNSLRGSYTADGDDITLVGWESTFKYCAEPTQQQRFRDALDATVAYDIDNEGTLTLIDAQGQLALRLLPEAKFSADRLPTAVPPDGSPEPTQSPAVVEGVEVRLRNDSDVDFDRYLVVFPDGMKVELRDLVAGGTSGYFDTAQAYTYAYVQVTVDGKKYTYQPVDYMGETQLKPGRYTYALDIVDGRLQLTFD